MARNRSEFRPDRNETSVFSKLYLTRRQRQAILKWVLYVTAVLVCSVVQDVVLCRLSVFGATTDLVPCVIFLICILEGVENGSLFTLLSALFFLFSGSSPGYFCVALITCFAIAVSLLRQIYLRKGFGSTMVCMTLAMLGYELVTFGIGVAFSLTYPGRLGVYLLITLLTLAVTPILYPIILSIEKIGGETWKE